MIHDEIVTYEVCKLAKEKGFDVPTNRYYHIYDDVIEAQNSLEMTGNGCADFYNSLNRCRCAAPTQSLLQRWLREDKDIHISINYQQGVDEECPSYDYSVYRWPINTEAFVSEEWKDGYSTYELALEDALKYALENLV